MSKRLRILLSAFFMTLSLIATATAATLQPDELATGPAGLLTGALLCIVLMVMVWSDDLDRIAVRRNRARRKA
jgi:hypothetical protein